MSPSAEVRSDRDEHLLTIRYGLLAWSICGRSLAAVLEQGSGWCGGRTIFVDRDDDVRRRRQAVFQAAMLRARIYSARGGEDRPLVGFAEALETAVPERLSVCDVML
jgi:hypothetical protein